MANGVKLGSQACLLFFFAIVGCSDQAAQQPPRDTTPERQAWARANTEPVSRTSIKLRDGRCLDTARLPAPWVQIDHPNPRRLAIAAPGNEVNIVPYEVAGRTKDLEGYPYDGSVRAFITGWSRPPGDQGTWRVASPAKIDEHIQSGVFSRTTLWSENDLGLEAYDTAGFAAYVDGRRFTQCKDYAGSKEIACVAVSADEQFVLTATLSSVNRTALPRVLKNLLTTVEAMRDTCT